ncbi:MAG: hypothetical protein PF961_05225, partial [Planctomycetota bacterium]|nr:hypothetical protein [Planctomycetota bacterium]
TYRGELALRGPNGQLVPLVASEAISTPPIGPSERLDEDWMAVDETFDELLVGAGLPGSSPSSVSMSEQRLRARLWSEVAAGPGIPPGSSDNLTGLPSSYGLPSSHSVGSSSSHR